MNGVEDVGLTQQELAKRIGYSEVYVRRKEAYVRNNREEEADLPSGPLAHKLAEGLEVPGDLRPAFIRFAQTGEYSQELDVLLGKGAPPSLSAAKIPTNLPALPTPLVGRGHQVRQIAKLLTQTEGRVVTLTGTGGTGKSRLALELGHLLLKDFPDGVWFIDLAPIREGGLVASTVARVLGIREEGSHTVENKILDFLKSKRALLLLDNFEQLLTPLDDDDDVQAVYSNFEVSDAVMEKLTAA